MTAEQILYWLVEFSIKSTLVLALAIAIVGTMKRCSAAARHMMGMLAIGSAALLPTLSATLPRWHVAILPRSILSPAESVPQTDGDGAWQKEDSTLRYVASLLGLPGSMGNQPNPFVEMRGAWSGGSSITRHRVAESILFIWGSGTMIALIPSIAGAYVVWRMGRRAEPVTDIYITSMFRGLLWEYSIRRNVKLLVGTQSMTPVAWGVFRPCVLLPPQALRWPADRLRAALLHELAHVKRWDCATQLLGQIACAIYWFNPMVWLMARQLRAEHERACDDMVLTWGLGEAVYAEHLVVIARSLRAPAMSMLSMVAMARPSELRQRLISILDPSARRGKLGFKTIAAALVLTLMLITPLAMLHAAKPLYTVHSSTLVPHDSAMVLVSSETY